MGSDKHINRDEPISMYVPARNAERTLMRCIQAIRTQKRAPDELFILVDPRSSDRTMEVARSTGTRIVKQQGTTLGAARNEAITAASHRWLASCDSDVVLEPDWLARLAAQRNTNAAGIGGRTVERIGNPFDQWRALHMPHHWGDYPLRNPFMLVSEVLFDREALQAVGGYRDDLNYYEDSDLCQRLREAGYDLFYEPSAVGTHLRSDSLLGLLTLRWKYAEYRQRPLMDRYAGLIEKTRINRDYAIMTLARSLARNHEELAYISFLLFFHHLVMDLRSLLSRRPLIRPSIQTFYEKQLITLTVATLNQRHTALGKQILTDLDQMTLPDRSERPSPTLTPGWATYLEAVQSALKAFCGEFTNPLLDIVASSAQYIRNEISVKQVLRLPRPANHALSQALATMPIVPFVDGAVTQSIMEQWPDMSCLQVVGPLHEKERTLLEPFIARTGQPANRTVAAALHTETRPDPLAIFDKIDPHIPRLVVGYQPPAHFVPGLDIMSAADLASAASAAGWQMDRFDTLVGRTQLMLTRKLPDKVRSCRNIEKSTSAYRQASGA